MNNLQYLPCAQIVFTSIYEFRGIKIKINSKNSENFLIHYFETHNLYREFKSILIIKRFACDLIDSNKC